ASLAIEIAKWIVSANSSSALSLFILLLLQYLKNLLSLTSSYNSQINATVFFLSKSCPSSPFSSTMCLSSSACALNSLFRSISISSLCRYFVYYQFFYCFVIFFYDYIFFQYEFYLCFS